MKNEHWIRHEMHNPDFGTIAVLKQQDQAERESTIDKARIDAVGGLPEANTNHVLNMENDKAKIYQNHRDDCLAKVTQDIKVREDSLNEIDQKIKSSEYFKQGDSMYKNVVDKIRDNEDTQYKVRVEARRILNAFKEACRMANRESQDTDGIKSLLLNPKYYWIIIAIIGGVEVVYNYLSLLNLTSHGSAIVISILCGAGTVSYTHLTLPTKA